MAFLDKDGLQTLTNKLVQGDAIKVASHRGHTVKNVIDNITRECENVATPNTMNLENRINEFKVGKSRDVDVSGDVEEGKIEVELQGKTWQNVVHGTKSVQSNIFTIEDGKYVFNNNATSSGGIIFSLICKPKTTYTLIINFLECALGDNTIYIDGHPVYLSTINRNLPKTKGTHAISFVTKDDVTDKKMKLAILSSSTSKLVIDENIIVLEGDHTQTPIEELPKYLEGIKSSFEDGVVDVEVQGKNLFDAKDFCDKVNNPNACQYEDGALIVKNSSHEIGFNYNFPCYISFNIKTSDSQNTGASVLQATTYDGSVIHLDAGINGERFKKHYVPNIKSIALNCWALGTNILKNFQIERTQFTPYEPYYKKKISFNIGEPLRSLPNGICDEIRNNNGQWELVRKIGKVVLDGSEGWYNSTAEDGASKYFTANDVINDIKRTITLNNQINSHFVIRNPYQYPSESCMWALWQNSSRIRISIKNISDLSEIKNWLSQNPTTIYYELETPIITPIEPIEFEVKPLATMTIDSEIAPISNHKVVLNRAGQIEQGIVQIAELKSRVDALETAYDSYLLETQHKLSILGFEYELESEEV